MKKQLELLTLAALLFPAAGFGLGFRIVDQNAEATARGDAFTATADNPSAIYYNPAGITQLQGQSLLLGSYGIYLQSKYTPSSGDAFRTRDLLEGAPQMFYTNTIPNTPISFGVGVYAPFGLGLAWPDNNPFRTMALRGSIVYLTVNPVIAWKINDALSVAAGATFNFADAELEQGILPTPNNQFKFKGHGTAVGFNLGVMWKPTEQHSFGVSYHSETVSDLRGKTTTAIPGLLYSQQEANGRFEFPQVIQAGYSFRPTPAWNFEADVDWTDWHHLKTITLNQGTGPLYIPFNWQSSFMYEFGATRYFANGYHLSGGFVYSQDSVPNGSFNPLVPDSDRYIFSTGLGWKKDRYSWDFAYQLAYGPPRSVLNGTVADGDYRFLSHALSFSVGYSF